MVRKPNDKENMPDFDHLNDWIIAEASASPKIQIKTNLDPQKVTEENPYTTENNSLTDEENRKFNTFFHDND